jgi:hypothetical protein
MTRDRIGADSAFLAINPLTVMPQGKNLVMFYAQNFQLVQNPTT